MSTLYELKSEWMTLLDMLEEGADPEVIEATLEGIDAEIEIKADNYARIIRQLEADVAALKSEIERMTERKKSLENNISRLKANLQDAMIVTGKEKFKTDLFSFGIQNNPPKVVIDDYAKIPVEYLIAQEPKVDNKAIKDFLSTTDDKRSFFAHLEQGKSLRIK